MTRIDTVPFSSGIDPRHDARRLALLYSLFASAWIILSDVGVGLWSGGAEFQLVLVEIGKGLFFVLITAVLLNFVAVRLLEQLRQQDQLLITITSAVAGVTSEDFFPTLVTQLAQTLDADYAYVATLLPQQRVRTIAAIADGTLQEPFEYDLAGTPCAQVLQGQLSYYRDARKAFPDDALLGAKGISAYIGMPLRNRQGEPMGILVVMSRRPLANVPLAEAVFTLFAERAAAEMAQRRGEDETRRRTRQIATVFDALNSYVFVSSLEDDRLIFANRIGQAAAGPEWESLRWNQVLGPRHPPYSTCPPLDAEGEPCVWEFQQTTSGLWFQCVDRIITWVDGSSVRLEIARDITETKRMEEVKEEMVAAVSHEMRTPLTAILGFSEYLLMGGESEEERRNCLNAIYRSTERLNELIDNFIHLQRLTARLIKPMQQQTNIRALFISSCSRLARQYPQHRTQIDCPAELTASGNPEQLQEVVDNLALNAAKFSPVDTLVTLAACQDGENILLRISDAGPGIPLELRKKVFEPFYRQDNTSRRHTGGAGLGLALVREIVALHRGEVWMEEGPGGVGSSFVVRLPSVREEEPDQCKD